MILVLCCLSFVQCSKGDSVIAPIMPSKEYISNNSGDTLYFEPDRLTGAEGDIFHPQVSPIMAEDVFNEIDDALTFFIGDGELPEDQFQFLFGTPDSTAKMNPPLLRFGFATPEKEFDPDEITVKLNGYDVSDKIRYSVYFHQGRKANFCLATWMPDMYLNPQNRHSFDIQINPKRGGQLEKRLSFGVQDVDPPKIIHAGFQPDDTMRFFHHNKIMVLTMMSPNVKIRDTLLNPDKWTIKYSDSGLPPLISSIEKISESMYSISFSSDFKVGKLVKATFTPTDGVSSNVAEFEVPNRAIERGGSMVRKLASSFPDCTYCKNGYGFGTVTLHSAVDCETLHTLALPTNCPHAGCSPGIRQGINWTLFNISDDYFNRDSDNGIQMNWYEPPSGVATCQAKNQVYDFRYTINTFFEMIAIDDPLQGYCLVDETANFYLQSDTTLPEIDAGATLFSIEERCATPPCIGDCRSYYEYFLTVRATDNNCVLPNPLFLIYYSEWGYEDQTPSFHYYPDGSQIIEPHVFEKKYKVDPNLFACAERLKIIVHDKKGNWNSKYREKIPAEDTTYINAGSQFLPYPHTVELDFGNRASNKQYINLEHSFNTTLDQTVCTYRIDHADHGSKIFIEATVKPPLPGIHLIFEYFDPPFQKTTQSPTNTIDKNNPDTVNITDTNNPFLYDPNGGSTLNEKLKAYYLLWGSHSPYSGDGRALGDNYNFHYDDISQFNNPAIPEWDPIKANNRIPTRPCFWNCIAVNPGEYCLDLYCASRCIDRWTYASGKNALYFESMAHGGDNFIFHVYADHPILGSVAQEKCLEATSGTFTLWRKITVQHAWMEPRGAIQSSCSRYGDEINYPDTLDYKINDNNISLIQGVYDDAFVEIVKGQELGASPYMELLQESDLNAYADAYTNFHPADFDTLELLGVDHGEDYTFNDTFCANGMLGQTYPLETPPNQHFHSYAFVGNIWDKIEENGYPININGKNQSEYQRVSEISASHELLHVFLNCDNNMHFECIDLVKPHGLHIITVKSGDLSAGMQMTSFLHKEHIIDIRSGVHDANLSAECPEESGFFYLDKPDDGISY